MKTKIIYKKSVTLIELLIAVSIFVVILGITLGAIGSVMRPKAKSKTIDDLSETGKLIIEKITQSVQKANHYEKWNSGTEPLYYYFGIGPDKGGIDDGSQPVINTTLRTVSVPEHIKAGESNPAVLRVFREDAGRAIMATIIDSNRNDHFGDETGVIRETISPSNIIVDRLNFHGVFPIEDPKANPPNPAPYVIISLKISDQSGSNSLLLTTTISPIYNYAKKIDATPLAKAYLFWDGQNKGWYLHTTPDFAYRSAELFSMCNKNSDPYCYSADGSLSCWRAAPLWAAVRAGGNISDLDNIITNHCRGIVNPCPETYCPSTNPCWEDFHPSLNRCSCLGCYSGIPNFRQQMSNLTEIRVCTDPNKCGHSDPGYVGTVHLVSGWGDNSPLDRGRLVESSLGFSRTSVTAPSTDSSHVTITSSWEGVPDESLSPFTKGAAYEFERKEKERYTMKSAQTDFKNEFTNRKLDIRIINESSGKDLGPLKAFWYDHINKDNHSYAGRYRASSAGSFGRSSLSGFYFDAGYAVFDTGLHPTGSPPGWFFGHHSTAGRSSSIAVAIRDRFREERPGVTITDDRKLIFGF